MDDAVLRALAKWPNVPACYGWLALDARGRWRLAGEVVRHAGLTAFLARNYASEDGAWFCQNGPQRAYVDLPGAPWVIRYADGDALETHSGLPVARLHAAWLDADCRLLVECEHGLALLADLDLPRWLENLRTADGHVADAAALASLQEGGEADLRLAWRDAQLPLRSIRIDQLHARHGIVASPQPAPLG